MNQEIKYSGFSAVPSDYECSDGSLAASINLVPEDGALKPVMPPAVEFHLSKGQNAIYIHKGNNYINYIISEKVEGKICLSLYGGDIFLTLQADETLTDICAVGNILVVSTSLNLYYIYFKDSQYKLLGNELPKPEMSFALSAQLVSKVHNTPLSFSDFQSADNTWKQFAVASFDTDMNGSGSTPPITSTIAKDIKINFAKDLEAATEYKLQASGSGFTDIYLYAAVSGSSQYEQIAHFFNGGTTKIKPTKTYTSFKANVVSGHGGVPSWHASGDIKVFNGFDSAVTGRVIEYNEANYNAVAASINKFVANEATNKSLFIYPFFVRYALRLYDGSYARISEPVLLVPNSGYAPMVSFKQDTNNLTLYSFVASLQYAFTNSIDNKWKDIIAGVDVFASQQAYPYNQGENFDASKKLFKYAFINSESGEDQITGTDFGYCDLPNISSHAQYGYSKHDLANIAKTILGFGDTEKQTDWRIIKLAPVDNQTEKLQQMSNFYLIYSFALDEIVANNVDPDDPYDIEYKNISLKDGTLSSLVTRQTLTDDSFSSCRFLDAHLTVYNQRLHLFDFHFQHPVPKTPAQLSGHIYRYSSYGRLYSVKVFIRTTNGERVVEQLSTDSNEYSASVPWFFYPHSKAYKAVLVYKSDDGKYYSATLKLTPHEFLYGAYWLADALDGTLVMSSKSDNDWDTTPVNDVSYYANSVLQSTVSCPFAFSESLLVTLGVQHIKAMASAAKALSQGQFGQFPLYAFTSEGVWALEVSSTGSYSARQPITRDVCINPDAITQLDSAVLFPTDRGIMLISGSQTQCISEAINSEYPFDAMRLPGFEKLHTMLGHEPATDKCLPTLPFTKFLKQSRMLYDYVHQRVIVYAPNITYAYVYSLKTNQWGMMFSRLTSHLNSYPDALAVNEDNAVINFSAPIKDNVKCLYVTRPLKLEAANVLKTFASVIQRGFFRKGNVSTVLYGSRNLQSWHLVWSSKDHYLQGFRGSPYKYFRIAGVATLSPNENIYGASVEFTPRQTNKPR